MYEKAGGSRRERPTKSERDQAQLIASLNVPKADRESKFLGGLAGMSQISGSEVKLFSTSTDGLSIDRIPTQSNDAQDQLPDRVVRFEEELRPTD